jgi:Fe-S-cluster containining protein
MKPGADELSVFYASVDERAQRLADRHGTRLHCRRGCAACCVDDLTVLEVEAEHIRRNQAALLRHGRPHSPGACAFLDESMSCRIYHDRPYVCRTQGLPLRWFENAGESRPGRTLGVVERRDICPENLEGPPLETLADEDCWLLGPAEGRLQEIQDGTGDTPGTRVSLRSLFRSQRAS